MNLSQHLAKQVTMSPVDVFYIERLIEKQIFLWGICGTQF